MSRRSTPCADAKNSLRNPSTVAVECNCCGLWGKKKMTDAHRTLRDYAVNANGKAVRL